MNEEKLCSDIVPGKFVEWLLAMGCPSEKVPAVETIAEMCRGQYYMVWRGLMEHVEAKDVIRQKRLQVFCDDVKRCRGKTVFTERQKNVIIPEQVIQWREQNKIKQKVESAEATVNLAKQDLEHLTDKISSKLSQYNKVKHRAINIQRRVYLLQQVAEELKTKITNLEESRSIADTLCSIDEEEDIEPKLDRCVSWMHRQAVASVAPNSTVNSSVLSSTENDFEEHLSPILRSHGDSLCSRLLEKRAALIKALSVPAVERKQDQSINILTPQTVVTYTAALHCQLALEAAKNKVHLKQARKRLLGAIEILNEYITGDSCELLVVRCEKAAVEARVVTLRNILDELNTRSGVFSVEGAQDVASGGRSLDAVHKAIESKRDEILKVISAMAMTERKIASVTERLKAVFSGFNRHLPPGDVNRYRGLELELPPETIAALHQFYEQRKERRTRNIDISMELDLSNGLLGDTMDNNNPKFVDELKIYLNIFNLEKNRKLVLETGEKVWIFETLQASMHRLHSKCLSDELSCALLCPSDSLTNNLTNLVQILREKFELESVLKTVDYVQLGNAIDIKLYIEEESLISDKTKMRLGDCLLRLQKTEKVLTLEEENLQIWADNNLRKFISPCRTVNGQTYKDYECYYLDKWLI